MNADCVVNAGGDTTVSRAHRQMRNGIRSRLPAHNCERRRLQPRLHLFPCLLILLFFQNPVNADCVVNADCDKSVLKLQRLAAAVSDVRIGFATLELNATTMTDHTECTPDPTLPATLTFAPVPAPARAPVPIAPRAAPLNPTPTPSHHPTDIPFPTSTPSPILNPNPNPRPHPDDQILIIFLLPLPLLLLFLLTLIRILLLQGQQHSSSCACTFATTQ